jgi:hypothetical protein
MVGQRFFDHVSPSGETIDERLASYVGGATGSWVTAENLAWGEGALATPAATVRSWMNSTGHRANILDPSYSEVGIGITAGSPTGSSPAVAATYVAEFGGHGAAAPESSELRAASAAPRPFVNPVSAKTKKQITRRCHTAARRVKSSKKARTARYDRCVKKAMRAAAR